MSAPELIGYRIGDLVGRGGSGTVYLADRAADAREVAVRVDDRPVTDRRRFLDDARTVRELSAHPHVVEVLDAGVLPDGHAYQVLELCVDGSLAGRAPLPPEQVAEVGQRIADVLVAAHDLGLTHGAVEPGKLLVKPAGTVGLTGFGLASLTADPRPDVPALAATLHALLAGSPAAPVADVPGVSPQFLAILRRGIEGGYPDAAALRADLSQLTVVSVPVRPTDPVPTGDTGDTDDDGVGGALAEPEPPSEPPGTVVLRWPPVILAVVVVLVIVGALVLIGR